MTEWNHFVVLNSTLGLDFAVSTRSAPAAMARAISTLDQEKNVSQLKSRPNDEFSTAKDAIGHVVFNFIKLWGRHVYEYQVSGVDVFDLDCGIQIDSIGATNR